MMTGRTCTYIITGSTTTIDAGEFSLFFFWSKFHLILFTRKYQAQSVQATLLFYQSNNFFPTFFLHSYLSLLFFSSLFLRKEKKRRRFPEVGTKSASIIKLLLRKMVIELHDGGCAERAKFPLKMSCNKVFPEMLPPPQPFNLLLSVRYTQNRDLPRMRRGL